MSAYHSYDGVPAVADRHILTEILRDEWGYKYFVCKGLIIVWISVLIREE